MKKIIKVKFDKVQRSIVTKIAVRRPVIDATSYAVNPSLSIRGLWDSGSEVSTISSVAARKLRLNSIDRCRFIGVGGAILAKRYFVDVVLSNDTVFKSVRVAEWDGTNEYDMLIGMDIISRGDFRIRKSGDQTVFSFSV